MPHFPTEPTDTQPPNRRAGRDPGMNQDGSPRHDPAHRGGTTRVIAANVQWHDAELALKVARHNFDRWLVAGHEDTRSPARLLPRLLRRRRHGPVFLAAIAPAPARQPALADLDPETGRARLSYHRAAEVFQDASGAGPAPTTALPAHAPGRGRAPAPDADSQKPPYQPHQPDDLRQANLRRSRHGHRRYRPSPPTLISNHPHSLPPTECFALLGEPVDRVPLQSEVRRRRCPGGSGGNSSGGTVLVLRATNQDCAGLDVVWSAETIGVGIGGAVALC